MRPPRPLNNPLRESTHFLRLTAGPLDKALRHPSKLTGSSQRAERSGPGRHGRDCRRRMPTVELFAVEPHHAVMRPDLPSGTVTFVFTDIEGSTRLLEVLGSDRYGKLLSQHHRVCRVAWAAHGGVEVDTAGDAFFVAFPTSSGAVAAASEAQDALAELGLRVRMGIHTGEVSVTETGYVGFDISRGARIAAAAHGGQVVVSQSTAALVSGHGLVDLGEHRFKDLAEPERIIRSARMPSLRSRACIALTYRCRRLPSWGGSASWPMWFACSNRPMCVC